MPPSTVARSAPPLLPLDPVASLLTSPLARGPPCPVRLLSVLACSLPISAPSSATVPWAVSTTAFRFFHFVSLGFGHVRVFLPPLLSPTTRRRQGKSELFLPDTPALSPLSPHYPTPCFRFREQHTSTFDLLLAAVVIFPIDSSRIFSMFTFSSVRTLLGFAATAPWVRSRPLARALRSCSYANVSFSPSPLPTSSDPLHSRRRRHCSLPCNSLALRSVPC